MGVTYQHVGQRLRTGIQRFLEAAEPLVERWIDERTSALDKEKINGKMEAFESSRTPDDLREQFEGYYPAELRTRYPLIFDLLEADDARLYAGSSAEA